MPPFSEDPVVDYMVMEAVTLKYRQEQHAAEEKAARPGLNAERQKSLRERVGS